MGKRGPAPKPTALKVLHGAEERHINRSEPKPSEGRVEPPSWLSAEARRVWRKFAPDLIQAGVLTPWDAEAFGCWCDAVVRRRQAALALARDGAVVEQPIIDRYGDPTGHVRRTKNPWVQVLNDVDSQLQRYSARFGMTPSDRAQLSIGGSQRGESAERLLGG